MLKIIKQKLSGINGIVTILYDDDNNTSSCIYRSLILDIDREGPALNRRKGYISKNGMHWNNIGDKITSGKIKINSSENIKLYKKNNSVFLIVNNYNSTMLISNNSIIETGNSYSHNYKEIPYIILELGK